VHGPRSRPRR